MSPVYHTFVQQKIPTPSGFKVSLFSVDNFCVHLLAELGTDLGGKV